MCWLFSSLKALNKHIPLIQFLKLSAKFMKIADLGPRQASKLEHFAKISFSPKASSLMFKRFQNPFMLSNIFHKLTRLL